MRRQTVGWALAALLGIVLAAAITWATSQLTGQRIGISSEPISAGSRLAPPVAERPASSRSSSTPTPSRTTTNPTTTTTQSPHAPTQTTPGPGTSVEAAPAPTLQPTPAPRSSTSSGDDGGDHGNGNREGGEREGREGGGREDREGGGGESRAGGAPTRRDD